MKRSDRAAGKGVSRRGFMAGSSALAAMAAFGTGVARASTTTAPKRGGHLLVGLDGASTGDSLDPATYASAFTEFVGMQCYNTLTEVDENSRVQPSLVERWEAKAGAREWVLKLRRGVEFHDGRTLKAADVVYSLNHHRGKDSKSAAKALLQPISDLTASGSDEITIKLSEGNADLPYLLAHYALGIAPEGASFDKGVGTGAFIIESFRPGIRALAKRNPNYWNAANRGWVDSVETLAINDPTARVSALQSGAIHIMNRLSPKIVGFVEKMPSVTVYSTSGAGHYSFPMRCDMAPFDNADLRLALKYAIDREEVLKKILRGFGKIGNDQPIPSFDPYYAADIAQRPYDPEKARFHWRKSGYSGSIPLSVSDAAFVGAVDAAQLYQVHAAKAGIRIEVVREPADGYWDRVWMKKAFCASYWTGMPTADLMLSIAYKSDASWNESFWKRPAFDRLLLQARSELDQTKRREMYRDLQLLIVDDGGELIPVFNNFIEAASAKVKGYVPTPRLEMSGYRAAEKVWLEI
jgi:peptide/nickel transport system substrate-binding protein